MRNTTIAVLACMAALSAPLTAQTQYNARVVQAMAPAAAKYDAPICPLKGGDYRTGSAGLYLKTAIQGFKDQSIGASQVSTESYNEGLKKALNSSRDALAVNPSSAAAWYYYGRASLQMGDLKGADSAFTKLVALSPDCEIDIKSMRQKAWLAVINPGTDFLNKRQFDSALVLLRDAMTISRYYPDGYYNLGAAFASMTPRQADSAIYYWKIAVDKAGNDPAHVTALKNSLYNMGMLYQIQRDTAAAIVQLKKYLAIDPANEEAKRSLSTALRTMGQVAEAVQIENQLLAEGKLGSRELGAMGVRAFNAKDFAGAAVLFNRVLAIEPANHDAMNNLANTYYAISISSAAFDSAALSQKLIDISQKLIESDPLNPTNLKLLTNGWGLAKNQSKQIEVVTGLQALTIAISVDTFAVRKDGVKLYGEASGLEGRTATDKVIPPAKAIVVFDFVDATGAVVVSKEVSIDPPLKPNEKQGFSLDVAGEGIVAWKYHKK